MISLFSLLLFKNLTCKVKPAYWWFDWRRRWNTRCSRKYNLIQTKSPIYWL